MSKLVNVKHVKEFILEKVESMRPGWKCERVSKEALDMIEAQLRASIIRMVQQHPTKGVTFKP